MGLHRTSTVARVMNQVVDEVFRAAPELEDTPIDVAFNVLLNATITILSGEASTLRTSVWKDYDQDVNFEWLLDRMREGALPGEDDMLTLADAVGVTRHGDSTDQPDTSPTAVRLVDGTATVVHITSARADKEVKRE